MNIIHKTLNSALTGDDIVDLSHAHDEHTIYWPTSPSAFELKTLAHGETEGGYFYASNAFSTPEHAIVVLRTGRENRPGNVVAYLGDDTPGDASRLHFPSFGAEAAEFLVSASILPASTTGPAGT